MKEERRKQSRWTQVIIHHLPQLDRCPASSQAFALVAMIPKPPSFPFSHQAWYYTVWNITLVSLSSLPSCVPSEHIVCPHESIHCGGRVRNREDPDANTSAKAKPGSVSTVLVKNLKHSTIWAAMKTNNSILAKLSSVSYGKRSGLRIIFAIIFVYLCVIIFKKTHESKTFMDSYQTFTSFW